ncbi:hypothetical protein CC78DRAFT_525148 [Lojkania enalia]|uniref:Nicotinamide N-methyltransferase n=1 Tax=Lojkania enalia TaxID=147567 RepID=A0A9P4MVP0_9PLEO|nr:hypothetical protein CC78DRAFT_525148 [Didymosphaeria enalia]
MLLPSLVTLRHPPDHELSPEDIFSSSLGSIFKDDLQNQHGSDSDTTIIYRNRRYGDLEFRVAKVNGEVERMKFAHYLWNAGILMGELVGGRAREKGEGKERLWSVKGETVLELGTGVGLAGIVSALSGATEVTMSDYPAGNILDAITVNVAKNVPTDLRQSVTVQDHKWGNLDTIFAQANTHRFTRILAADCLWEMIEHNNLVSSMLHFLSQSSDARVLCIAGFHTGRAEVVNFFEATIPKTELEIEEIFEMDANGRRQPWVKEDSGGEDIGERKKWLVVARLRRKCL